MADYRGFVPGPNGEMLAPTTVTPAQMAAAREAETARINRAVDARLAQEAAARAARERSAAESGEAELDAYKSAARAALLGSGGSAGDFERLWPELRSARLKAQADSKLGAQDRLIAREADALRRSGRYTRM
jgi:hypothetical protein